MSSSPRPSHPAPNHHNQPPPQQPEPPEPYELAIIQSLQSRTASLRRTFLTLDANGDGYIDRTDLRVALHNVLGVDLTTAQLDGLYARFCYFEHVDEEQDRTDGEGRVGPEGASPSSISTINKRGVRYHAFVDYITATTAVSHPSSEYGSAALYLLRPDASLQPIVPTQQQRVMELRRQLGSSIRSRTVAPGTPSTSGQSAHPHTDATLFLHIDTHKTGYISLDEFTTFVRHELGYSAWTDDDIRLVLGEHYCPAAAEEGGRGVDYNEFVRMVFELEDMDVLPTTTTEDGDKKGSVHTRSGDSATAIDNEARQQADALLAGTVLRIAYESKSDGQVIRQIAQALYDKHTRMVDAFHQMDADGTGRLSCEEFHHGLEEVELGIGVDRLQKLMSKFGGDSDGRLSLPEFVRLISQASTDEMASFPAEVRGSLYPAVQNGLLSDVLVQDEGEGSAKKGRELRSSQSLDEEDIAAIVRLREGLERERLTATKAFAKMNRDQSKHLDKDELKTQFEKMGVSISDDHVEHIVQRFDKEGKGKLQYHQFVKLLSADLGV